MEVIVPPFTIVHDQREGAPYTFQSIVHGQKRYCPMVKEAHLKTGDYAIEGWEHRAAWERKSKEDAYGTFGHGRQRFERELERLNEMEFACVVVEDEWQGLIFNPPSSHSRMKPFSVMQSVIAWRQRFVNVHWIFVPGRAMAEQFCFWDMLRFWNDRQEGAAA